MRFMWKIIYCSKYNDHKDQKDFICRACGKSFTQASYLRLHIKTLHEGHKEFKYDSCEESFTILSNFIGHIKTIHEGHKDNKCGSCEKYLMGLLLLGFI